MRRSSPKDLLALKESLQYSARIKETLIKKVGLRTNNKILDEIITTLNSDESLQDLIGESIKPDASNQLNEGNFIKSTYHPKISELYALINDSNTLICKYKLQYQRDTNIDNLKISHNNILGLFIEVTAKQVHKIVDPKFIHRQTTVNNVRFTTQELQQLESDMVNAKTLAINLEQELYFQICNKILEQVEKLRKLANSLSVIDVFCCFAYIADEYEYTKPIMSEEQELIIEQGRHPIVERCLLDCHSSFVANDCTMSLNQRLWLITGPNMAGKSTFLRQNALIVLLAQIGCFVPAAHAKIGVVDKLFSRIGAADDLSRGQSTFMVEMLETSAILAQSTKKSLIILDEVGRGTSTYDGVSIAWAILEYIHDKLCCRSLFATHYYELTNLTHALPAIKNYTIAIEDQSGKIVFSHKIIPGTASQSYGIHVAELAGLPKEVISKAYKILSKLEKAERTKKLAHTETANLSLFDNTVCKVDEDSVNSELLQFIKQINPDGTTPKQALNLIYQMKQKIK